MPKYAYCTAMILSGAQMLASSQTNEVWNESLGSWTMNEQYLHSRVCIPGVACIAYQVIDVQTN